LRRAAPGRTGVAVQSKIGSCDGNAPNDLSPTIEAGRTVRVLAPGELLFRQGDPATAIYKVESGRLRLIRRTVDDHLVTLHTARRGEFFAEASLFADAYHCDAVAAAPPDPEIQLAWRSP
jgi:CRP-like cAMP-binding protein